MPLAPQELRTYFITTVTASRKRLFQVERNALLLMEVLADQRAKGNIALHAFVIMPDHVHLLLTPAEMVSLEKAMQFVKGVFSFWLKSKKWTSGNVGSTAGVSRLARTLRQEFGIVTRIRCARSWRRRQRRIRFRLCRKDGFPIQCRGTSGEEPEAEAPR